VTNVNDSTTASPARNQRLWADLLLLLVAVVWGSAFVAQRLGMEQVGPFAFNATRFAVGALALIPILGWKRLRATQRGALRDGAVLGLLLFGAASLQQIGLIWTTAGKAGFITGLYVIFVPLLLALFWREFVGWLGWLGAGLAAAGLLLLSVQGSGLTGGGFRLAPGDGWVLGSAVVWALHVIAIGRMAPGRDPLRLAWVQFIVCSLLSLAAALVVEPGTWPGLLLAVPAVLYAGVISIGLGYTGQVVAQRHTGSTRAAIILSTESVFAALFGWLALGEALTALQLAGCGLMLAGMLLAQLPQASEDGLTA